MTFLTPQLELTAEVLATTTDLPHHQAWLKTEFFVVPGLRV